MRPLLRRLQPIRLSLSFRPLPRRWTRLRRRCFHHFRRRHRPRCRRARLRQSCCRPQLIPLRPLRRHRARLRRFRRHRRLHPRCRQPQFRRCRQRQARCRSHHHPWAILRPGRFQIARPHHRSPRLLRCRKFLRRPSRLNPRRHPSQGPRLPSPQPHYH
jgi:hypothetical protein